MKHTDQHTSNSLLTNTNEILAVFFFTRFIFQDIGKCEWNSLVLKNSGRCFLFMILITRNRVYYYITAQFVFRLREDRACYAIVKELSEKQIVKEFCWCD